MENIGESGVPGTAIGAKKTVPFVRGGEFVEYCERGGRGYSDGTSNQDHAY